MFIPCKTHILTPYTYHKHTTRMQRNSPFSKKKRGKNAKKCGLKNGKMIVN